MGVSLTGTHVIFFIASVIIASAVSGVFMAVVSDVSSSLSERGERLQEQLDVDFKVINDNENIPDIGGYYYFYMKNIGRGSLITTNETFQLFSDGELISKLNYYFSDSSIKNGEVATICVLNFEIAPGDHTLRVVGPQATEDEFEFTI